MPTWEHACMQGFLVEELRTMDKVRKYQHFGVVGVWAIDPVSSSGRIHSRNGVVSVEDHIFSADRFDVDLSKAEF